MVTGDPSDATIPQKQPLVLAIGQVDVGSDVAENGRAIRGAMRRARDLGARLVQFPEAALSGYVKRHVTRWDDVDWAALERELDAVCAEARALGLWVVVGCNRRSREGGRPVNGLVVIADDGRIVTTYAKRILSFSEQSDWYAAGTAPAVFAVDGWRFGLALCIEVQFPALFEAYERDRVDAILLSSFSEDPIFAVLARAHAATNTSWVSLVVPAACSAAAPSECFGPDGSSLVRCDPGSAVAIGTLDVARPAYEIALERAKPWRRSVRGAGFGLAS